MTRINELFAFTAPNVGFRSIPQSRKSQSIFGKGFPYGLREQLRKCESS